ncbi:MULTISPECIES: hypothetical protein [unclassified Sphingopyxis]|uniref:hypothetical protein n=1 Tax=unclassified Sphingopyxis TaxID=2614943 RepID=UPI00073174CE|nr:MULTISPECIES: hypothetical protein [unclassified Sphingopyxis]KTE25718.1 hypothetical protein ATE61_08215 [Sphingopyxis sp. H057]KTE51399.1 hypothetical protein ATE64_12635 [Sphingopyxis sp. H073]KTE54103.1 hypothetical protein ATE69_11845 [Sphingopyxis sp. H071]KTE57183.1 hypothetical protein ATE66_18420 [Sphingopyxis sp. H107]KTE61771.1 hypothetical protein ATE65_17470 [Sphingopyxis sp. H100]
MRRIRMLMLVAALASPVAAGAKEPIGAAGLKAIEAKVPPQGWYPDGYYDIRIAAEGQIADFPRDTLTMDWGDGQPPYYDVIDCNAEYVSLDETDPLTARYGGVALEVARLRAEFERMKYPVAVYAEPLLAFEKAMIEDAKAAPEPMSEADIAAADAAMEADVSDAAAEPADGGGFENDPYYRLAQAVEANRARLAPKLPKVVADGGCGAGEGNPVVVRTSPPQGEVLMINAFAFKVCTRKKPDPWDRFACKWNEIETGVDQTLSGRYVYQVKWPDGTVRKGTREIAPSYDDEPKVTVTFKKTGS